jgi:hypothetical protein
MRPENLPRPYLYKDSGFRIEKEVRFVVAANPVATDSLGGAIINIAAQSIISDFKVSREIPCEEKRCSILLARERLNRTAKPPSQDDEPALPEWEPFLSEPNLRASSQTWQTSTKVPQADYGATSKRGCNRRPSGCDN